MKHVLPFSIQIATPQDAEELSRFVNQAYRGESSKRGWTSEADILGGQRIDAEMLVDQIMQTENKILRFTRAGALVACVFLQQRQDTAYLGMFTVDPLLQAAGIGKAVLKQIEEWAADEWNARRIEMMVISRREELIAWYVRRGYRVTPRREPFPSHDPKFGIPKVEGLEMVILEKTLHLPTARLRRHKSKALYF